MKYLKISEISTKWNIKPRTIREYCQNGRIPGSFLDGKTWMIPENAIKPARLIRHTHKTATLLEILRHEKDSKIFSGIYHKLQIDMTYNSNHIEGSKLSHDETKYIFETNTIGLENERLPIDDIIETVNHFRCIDLVIDLSKSKLNESFIKQMHYVLKSGTTDSRKPWFKVGDYKTIQNEVGGLETTKPENVTKELKDLLFEYNNKQNIKIEDIIDFHYKFEKIHPFQDGNGRVGRLIMLKECLKYNIVPILITDEFKYFYYNGLKQHENEKGYLIETCLNGQDIIKKYLEYFNIKY